MILIFKLVNSTNIHKNQRRFKSFNFPLWIGTVILFFSFNINAGSWTNWKQVDTHSFVPIIFTNLSDVIGNGPINSWYSENKLDAGKLAVNYWIENYTDQGYLLINYLKMPPAWYITDSGNDRKYLKEQAQFILNVERKSNPLKSISKKDIERYRDVYNNVVPYVLFDFDNSVCLIFKKGYYKNESGYVVAAHDDETLVGIFCKNNGSIDSSLVENIINSIDVKK